MPAYNHYVIAHGKALAECLSQRRPLSDSKYKTTFFDYDLVHGRVRENIKATIYSYLSSTKEQPPVGLQALPITEFKHS